MPILLSASTTATWIGALQLGHGALRNQQRAHVGSGRRADPAILSRAQHVSGIGKQSRDPNRAGCLIHLAIREVELPVVRIDRAVRQNQFQPQSFRLRVQGGLRENRR